MSLYGIHHWALLTKNLVRRKLYLIAMMNLGSETLAMLGIRVMAKFGGMTHRVEPEDRSGGKRARPERHDLTG